MRRRPEFSPPRDSSRAELFHQAKDSRPLQTRIAKSSAPPIVNSMTYGAWLADNKRTEDPSPSHVRIRKQARVYLWTRLGPFPSRHGAELRIGHLLVHQVVGGATFHLARSHHMAVISSVALGLVSAVAVSLGISLYCEPLLRAQLRKVIGKAIARDGRDLRVSTGSAALSRQNVV
jgi:hypothetical protein